METANKRLEAFIKHVFGTKKNFCDFLGVSKTWATAYTGAGKSIIRDSRIVQKLSTKGFNYNWYLTGEGEMLVDNIYNLSGGDIDRIEEASLHGETKFKSNVAKVSSDIKAPIIDLSRMTPLQAAKLLKEIDYKYENLKKLAEIAEEYE